MGVRTGYECDICSGKWEDESEGIGLQVYGGVAGEMADYNQADFLLCDACAEVIARLRARQEAKE